MGAPSLQNRHADRWEVRGPARCVMPSRSRGLEPTVATCTSDPFRTSYIHLNNGTQREGAYLDMYSRSWHEASKAYLLEGILFCISARFGTSQRARSPYLGPTRMPLFICKARVPWRSDTCKARVHWSSDTQLYLLGRNTVTCAWSWFSFTPSSRCAVLFACYLIWWSGIILDMLAGAKSGVAVSIICTRGGITIYDPLYMTRVNCVSRFYRSKG